MKTVDQALDCILSNLPRYPIIEIPYSRAAGRVLRESIYADRDMPPFDRAKAHGIAINYSAYSQSIRRFKFLGRQATGMPAMKPVDEISCYEVAAGAILPEEADTVIPFEKVTFKGAFIILDDHKTGSVFKNQYVHKRGSYQICGSLLVSPGIRLTARHIAVAASVGATNLAVTRWPTIVLISIGDELVRVEDPVQSYQLRTSNIPALCAVIHSLGLPEPQTFHLKQDLLSLESNIKGILKQSDIVLICGGVSSGESDIIPSVLDKLGVEQKVHGIQQQPGDAMCFGQKPDGPVVFALPDNPLSTITCFTRYVLPAMRVMLVMRERLPVYVKLAETIEINEPTHYFVPVRNTPVENGQVDARPVISENNRDYVAIVETDGFIELPGLEKQVFPAGTLVRYFAWD